MAASGLTYVQIVNRILAQLREDSVTNYDDTSYSAMIAALVNQVKSEIEDAWYWHALRDTFQIATTNNTSQYALTGSGMNSVVLDAWNISQGIELIKGTVADFNSKFFGTGAAAVATGSPMQYLLAGLDANYDQVVDVWPIPVTGKLDTLKVNLFRPQADLAANATVPLVSQDLLIKETIARAKFEKGEDGAPGPLPGESFILKDILAVAVMRDSGTDPSEMDWEAD